MPLIKLSQGKFSIVDRCDYEAVSANVWYLSADGYAVRNHINASGNKRVLRMHRQINNTPNGKDTDHINGNKLDNRRTNLRACNRNQNCWNSVGHSDNPIKFKGVSLYKPNGKFRARICKNYKSKLIGYYDTSIEAFEAYQAEAKKMFGQFARI